MGSVDDPRMTTAYRQLPWEPVFSGPWEDSIWPPGMYAFQFHTWADS